MGSDELSCPGCGAPVGRSLKTTASGWIELPPIPDMSRLRAGDSTCQIEGNLVPAADFNLAAGDFVYFAHHVLLWRDVSVQLQQMPLSGGLTRLLAGLPVVMTEAHGPGHVAFSHDEPGEMIALPLQPGQKVDVREHMLLAATRSVSYGWFDPGVWYQTEHSMHYPLGQTMDRFTAHGQPGLLLLHASGNVFVRDLAPEETLLVKSAALIFKDPTVRMSLQIDYPMTYGFGGHRLMWIHVTGPGRVAVRSAYEHEEHGIESISVQSPGAIRRSKSGLTGSAAARVDATSAPDAGPKMDSRHALLAEMAAGALADGELSADEMARLTQVGKEHGLSEYDVRLIINHVKHHRH
jgi:uncharacterized protein (AIM24 family)